MTTEFKKGDKVRIKDSVTLEIAETIIEHSGLGFPEDMKRDFNLAKKHNGIFIIDELRTSRNCFRLVYNRDIWTWPTELFELVEELEVKPEKKSSYLPDLEVGDVVELNNGLQRTIVKVDFNQVFCYTDNNVSTYKRNGAYLDNNTTPGSIKRLVSRKNKSNESAIKEKPSFLECFEAYHSSRDMAHFLNHFEVGEEVMCNGFRFTIKQFEHPSYTAKLPIRISNYSWVSYDRFLRILEEYSSDKIVDKQTSEEPKSGTKEDLVSKREITLDYLILCFQNFIESRNMKAFSDIKIGNYFIVNGTQHIIDKLEQSNYQGDRPILISIEESNHCWPFLGDLKKLKYLEPKVRSEKKEDSSNQAAVQEKPKQSTNSYFHEPITIKQNKTNVNSIKLL